MNCMNVNYRTGRFLLILCGLVFCLSCFIDIHAADQKYTVILYGRKGELIDTFEKKENDGITLPVLEDEGTYTFLGWDTVRGKKKDPKYFGLQKLTLKRNLELYAVFFDFSAEKQLMKNDIRTIDTKRYQSMIVVGSSSIVHTKRTMESVCGDTAERCEYYLGKGGCTLKQFLDKKNDVSEAGLLRLIRNIDRKDGKPIAVIFTLGRNDLKYLKPGKAESVAEIFVTYLKKLQKKLVKNNCRLFYESVTQVNSATCRYHNERTIYRFNNAVKELLPGNIAYIDMYNWLCMNGYSYREEAASKDDGLHFSDRTYRRMHNYRVRAVNCM